MSEQYDNTNRIVLFRNGKKQPGDKLPSFKGKLNVNGKDFEVSLWAKESKSGEKYLSGQIQTPRNIAPAKSAAPAPDKEFDEADIPF